MAEIFLDFKQVGILIPRFAYAIMPVGKRDCKSMWTKNEALSTANTEGFFLFIYSRQETTRACLKKAFCKMCVTICGRFCPDEGAVAGYGN